MYIFFLITISTLLFCSDGSFIIQNKTHAKHLIESYVSCIEQTKESDPNIEENNGIAHIQSNFQKFNSYLFLFNALHKNCFDFISLEESSQSSESSKNIETKFEETVSSSNIFSREFLMQHCNYFNIPFIDKQSKELLQKDSDLIKNCQKTLNKVSHRLKYWLVDYAPIKNEINQDEEDFFYFHPKLTAKRIITTLRYLKRQEITGINVPVKINFFDDIQHAKAILNAFDQCRITINSNYKAEETCAYSEIVSILRQVNTLLFLYNTTSDTRRQHLISFSTEEKEWLDMVSIFKQQKHEDPIPAKLMEHCTQLQDWILYKNNWYEQDLPIRDDYLFIYKKNNENTEKIYFNVYSVADIILHAYQLTFDALFHTKHQEIFLLLQAFIPNTQGIMKRLQKTKDLLKTEIIIETIFQKLEAILLKIVKGD